MGRSLVAAGRERGIADLADGLVKLPEGRCDALPGRVAGQVDGRLQAEPDVEEAGDDRVEQFLAALCLPGRGLLVRGRGRGGGRAALARWSGCRELAACSCGTVRRRTIGCCPGRAPTRASTAAGGPAAVAASRAG
jgi:hypothetical protein